MNPETIKALQVYMTEECDKFGALIEHEDIIRNEPMKAFEQLCLLRIVTPGFIKYFENKEYKQTLFNDFNKLYTIEDEKFKALSNDCKCINMLREVYRLGNDDNVRRHLILKNLGIKMDFGINEEVLTTLYKIRFFKIKLEMLHEKLSFPLDIGNIHVVKEGDKYVVINGNHRLLGYMYYCVNVIKNFKPISVWLGE